MNLIRAAAFVALALGACNLNNPGFDAPVGELSYPIAIALSDPSVEGGPAHLYVANSNFDLRYNGGSVQTYDLAALESLLAENECLDEQAPAPEPTEDAGAAPRDAGPDAETDAEADAGADLDAEADAGPADPDAALFDAEVEAGAADASADARVTALQIDAGLLRNNRSTQGPRLCDGRGDSDDPRTQACCFSSRKTLNSLRTSEISVDSYANGITTSPDGAHLYVPLRSQSRLLHLDVDEAGQLSCGSDRGRCRRGPRYGREAEIDELSYPALPTAVLTGRLADLNITDRPERYFAATVHEKGEISLFALSGAGSPRLLYTLPTTLPNAAIQALRPGSLRLDNGFFLVGTALTGEIGRIAARADVPANDAREQAGVYLYATQPIAINGLYFTEDIRDAQADERDRAAGTPRRYYALLSGGRGPLLQSVGFLELDSSSPDGRLARAVDAVRVGFGLSKLVQADVGGRHLLFVSCYSDGEIHVIDADARKTVTVIRDVLGPSDMKVDSARNLLYATDFRASVIRVIDLRSLTNGSGGVPRVVATLGAPYLPGNVK